MENGAVAMGLAGLGIGLIFYLAIIVMLIIAEWILFTKMGEPGWKSLIPFYNVYVLYEKIWKGIYGVIMFGAIVVSYTISTMMAQSGNTNIFLTLISLILMVVGLVLGIMGQIKLGKAFGKSSGFIVGLVLLSNIFLMILAFGKSRYLGNPEDPGFRGMNAAGPVNDQVTPEAGQLKDSTSFESNYNVPDAPKMGEPAAPAAPVAPVAAEPAEAPVETPAAPAEAPVEAPVEAPAEAPAEAPVEAPAEAPVEAPAESPAEPGADTPEE